MKRKTFITLSLFFINLIVLNAQEYNGIYEIKSKINITDINNYKIAMPINTYEGKKSVGLAILYSVILPGMGELYAGDYSLGKYLTAADVVFWGATIGLNRYGKWQEDNYKAYAKSKGGVTYSGDDQDFYARVGSFMSVYSYNREKELNREFNKVYNTDVFYWEWKDNIMRKEYRNMWTSSEQAYNNVRFAVGALILNRIASVINAVRLVNKHNKNLSLEQSWNVNFSTENLNIGNSGIRINFIKSF